MLCVCSYCEGILYCSFSHGQSIYLLLFFCYFHVKLSVTILLFCLYVRFVCFACVFACELLYKEVVESLFYFCLYVAVLLGYVLLFNSLQCPERSSYVFWIGMTRFVVCLICVYL